ncbi:MAG: RNA methyltransferase [Bacteroidales bacterium]|nr:RNA methyltransferase [Bacteroidales bacterium]
MLSKAEIKRIKSLKEKKFRDEYSQFVVEGEKMVQEALSSTFKVVAVYREEEIGAENMAKISQLSSPSPVLAVVEKPAPKGAALERGLYLGLDSVRDPGNMGTILRLADWFGISTVFTSMDCVEVYNPKVVQASMGSVFRVKTFSCDLPEICRRFRHMDLGVYGTFLDGKDIYAENLPSEGLIVMGNEANGISDGVAAEVSTRLLIPSFADGRTAESLNVATATAITLSEFRRRSR